MQAVIRFRFVKESNVSVMCLVFCMGLTETRQGWQVNVHIFIARRVAEKIGVSILN